MSTRALFPWLLALSLSAANVPSYLVQTAAGSDYIGDGGPASRALLSTAEGVAADPLGNYYVSDTDYHRIRRISPKGIITTIAGNGKPGFAGDGGPASAAQLNLPYGLAADLVGNLYVADFGNHCVRKIAPDGRISTVAGLTIDTQMEGPRNLALDPSGNLYISDFSASRIYRRTPQGAFTAYAGSPTATGLGDSGLAVLARLSGPTGLAVDLAGTLYISDSGNKLIRKVAGGIITTLAVKVSTPVGMAINYASELYVADYGSQALLKVTNLKADKPTVRSFAQDCRDIAVDYNGNILVAYNSSLQTFNGSVFTVIAGGNDASAALGDEDSALSARLNHPRGVARDPAGSLYIADSADKRIRKVTPDGLIHTFLSGLANPTGLAFDGASGKLYIADAGAHTILIATADGRSLTLAGSRQGFSGDGGPARFAQLNSPSAVAFDALTSTLYIADEGNNRIRAMMADGTIRTVANIQAPGGLVIDAAGRLVATESAMGRIVQVSPGGVLSPISNLNLWTTPRGLAVDRSGALYVADADAHRITRLDPDGTVSLISGNGNRGLDGDGGMGLLATFDTPTALAVDATTGAVYVADTNNNRVRVLTIGNASAAPITAPSLITVVNAASRLLGPVAAGELISLIGTGIETYDILVNSTPVQPTSNNIGEAIIALPDALDVTGTVEIQVLFKGVPVARVTPTLAPAAVGLFPGRILNEDGTMNSMDNPAPRGTAIRIYGSGEGRTGGELTALLDDQPLGIAAVAPAADNPNIFEMTAYVPGGYFGAGAKRLIVSTGQSSSQVGIAVYVR